MSADELPPIARPGKTRAAHAAPIAYPVQICADELSSIAQALKTSAGELRPISQAGKTRVAHVARIAHR